ncbi:aspartyl protease family protein [Reichenbachiella sp. MALMAid0571]|uniref:aspartyl protease family protein n=1 Tax=Reichenbachiella sp. MALMAid0571 TaxID=3143939 RepID=UPI0032E00020
MKKTIGLIIIAIFSNLAVSMAQSPLTSVPFELYGDHVFVKIKVNNSRDLDFIFDTGDGLTVLNIETAKELNMVSGADTKKTSAEGEISGKLLKHQSIEINNIELRDIEIYETSLRHLEISIGRKIDGIIGYDMLENYVVSMNFNQMSFDLFDSKGYEYKGTGRTLPIKLTSYIPHISANVVLANGETITGEFFVDTGAKATVDFNTPYVTKHGMIDKIGDSYIYLVSGLGKKEYEHHQGKAKSLTFSGFGFENVPVGLSHAEHGIQNHKKVTGILGSGLLRKFNVTYNYPKHEMYWEKNDRYSEPFQINASGLELQLSEDMSKVMIHKVFDNSPAEDAGIKVDSELNEVSGKSAIEVGLPELRRILSESGKTVKIKVDGKSIDLKLKALI